VVLARVFWRRGAAGRGLRMLVSAMAFACVLAAIACAPGVECGLTPEHLVCSSDGSCTLEMGPYPDGANACTAQDAICASFYCVVPTNYLPADCPNNGQCCPTGSCGSASDCPAGQICCQGNSPDLVGTCFVGACPSEPWFCFGPLGIGESAACPAEAGLQYCSSSVECGDGATCQVFMVSPGTFAFGQPPMLSACYDPSVWASTPIFKPMPVGVNAADGGQLDAVASTMTAQDAGDVSVNAQAD
jgi:hypothetical protein